MAQVGSKSLPLYTAMKFRVPQKHIQVEPSSTSQAIPQLLGPIIFKKESELR